MYTVHTVRYLLYQLSGVCTLAPLLFERHTLPLLRQSFQSLLVSISHRDKYNLFICFFIYSIIFSTVLISASHMILFTEPHCTNSSFSLKCQMALSNSMVPFSQSLEPTIKPLILHFWWFVCLCWQNGTKSSIVSYR